jgi:hypothetical protein
MLCSKRLWLHNNHREINHFGFNEQRSEIKDNILDSDKVNIACLEGTREQLEDHEFKNTELGEEWWKYRIYNFRYRTPYTYFGTEEEALETIEELDLDSEEESEETIEPIVN